MKAKYILVFTAAVLVFSLSFNSCMLISPPDEESGGIETEKPEDNIKDEPEITEKDSESTQIEKDKKTEEKEEIPENLEEPGEEKDIIVASPQPNQIISSPLIITGEARGTWFFEANFPVRLLDGNGDEIAVHYAEALGEWMTEDFVPFQAEIEFEEPDIDMGFLILEKNNPSDIREYDDEIIIPVRFE